MITRPALLIYIPSYNRFDQVVNQLTNLSQQLEDGVMLYVSDNCSTDERYLSLPQLFQNPRIKFDRNRSNLGIVGNIIKGFLCHEAKYLWVLSDDDDVQTDAIHKILAAVKDSPTHIYLESKIKGEENLSSDIYFRADDILNTFSSASMTGLISANIYHLDSCSPYVEAGYRFGQTLFPHSAIFYSMIHHCKHDLKLKVIRDVVKWNFTTTSYEEIHDQAWIHYLDLARIFDERRARIFVRKYLKDWGRTHLVKIMLRNNSMPKLWYYAFTYPRLFHLFLAAFLSRIFFQIRENISIKKQSLLRFIRMLGKK